MQRARSRLLRWAPCAQLAGLEQLDKLRDAIRLRDQPPIVCVRRKAPERAGGVTMDVGMAIEQRDEQRDTPRLGHGPLVARVAEREAPQAGAELLLGGVARVECEHLGSLFQLIGLPLGRSLLLRGLIGRRPLEQGRRRLGQACCCGGLCFLLERAHHLGRVPLLGLQQ